MPLQILFNTQALGVNCKTVVDATGGVPPYTFSIVSGGGSINGATGEFTAANTPGRTVLRVTDSDTPTPSTSDVNISTLSPMQLFCDIIKQFMGLSADQIYIYNQKFRIPPDDRIYVAVRFLQAKPFSNVIKYGSTSGLQATQESNFYSQIMVDIFGTTIDALDRKEEIVMALKSVYSQQQQQLNSLSIAALPISFNDLSQLEGSAIPYRFNITVAMQYLVKKLADVSYFDDFDAPEVQTDP